MNNIVGPKVILVVATKKLNPTFDLIGVVKLVSFCSSKNLVHRCNLTPNV